MTSWPLKSNIIRKSSLSNTFGLVRRYADGREKPHQGWDFSAVINTPCFAVDSGLVVASKNEGDYGLQVTIRLDTPVDGQTIYAHYAHMGSIGVIVGAKVRAGQEIGLTGESGNARGMALADQHLHFELRTTPAPGLGLTGRISPLRLFGKCPLIEAIQNG